MGWTGVYDKPKNDKKGLRDYFAPQYTCENEKNIFKFLDLSKKGSVLYILFSIFNKETSEERITVDVVLTSYADNMFSYKEMNESMEPYYYDPPKKFLDALTPTDSEWANEWRRKCKEKNEKTKLLKPGVTIHFTNPVSFKEGDIQRFVVWDETKNLFKKPDGSGGIYRIKGFKNMSFEIIG